MLFRKNIERLTNHIVSYLKNIYRGIQKSEAVSRVKGLAKQAKEITVTFAEKRIGKTGRFEKVQSFVASFREKTVYAVSSGILVFVLICGVVGSNLTFGYRVTANGQAVGVTDCMEAAQTACNQAAEELKLLCETETPLGEVEINRILASKSFLYNSEEMESALVAAFDNRVNGYGIFVEGTLVTAMATEEEARQVLELYQLEYVNENTRQDAVTFNKPVTIDIARVDADFMKDQAGALADLKAPQAAVVKHIIKEGDSFYSLAEQYHTTAEKLLAYNPGITPELLQLGQEIFVSETAPLLQVQTKELLKATEAYAYPTEQVDDPDNYVGVSIVTTEGVPGEKEVEYEVIKENGIEVNRVAISEIVVKEPVTAVVKVGSKKRPSTASTGTFATPFYGTVTSRFGSRWGGTHTGIDLAGATGSSVVAADGGTVSFAGWSGGYGKLIKIRHDNGYETYYAHLSSINVSVGQKVAKKQFIGRVGNTGNSTGPHLHFEIRKNGKALNPANYMK